jgi:sulfite reductase (NADPH) flavoprotein alpha-component
VEEEVHLTVGVVRYRQEDGTVRSGGASSYLADRLPEDAEVRVFVEHNDNFRLPANPDTPVIMVGPGTGIARSAPSCRSGKHRGRGQELALLRQPPLHPGLPLSGGVAALCEIGPAVQDLPGLQPGSGQQDLCAGPSARGRAELYQWLEAGAHFYVCGDANHMAKDVQEALLEVIAEHGHKSREEAEEYLSELRRAKRYQRDVY